MLPHSHDAGNTVYDSIFYTGKRGRQKEQMTFLIGNTAYIRTVLMAVALGLFFLLMYKFAAHAIVDRYVMAGRRLYDRLSSAMINADKDSPFHTNIYSGGLTHGELHIIREEKSLRLYTLAGRCSV